jgi:acylphosphatase
MLKTINILVTGKVQGVFYRQSARQLAHELGISGTIKNCADGSVNIRATGTGVQLEHFTNWCRKGPARAVVAEIIIESVSLVEYTGFVIIR